MSAERTTQPLNTEQKYYAENILKKRRVGRGGKIVQYLVKWRDYSDEHNKWVPFHNLMDCTQLIDEFERTYANPNSSESLSSRPLKRKRGEHLRKKSVENTPKFEINGNGEEVPEEVVESITSKRLKSDNTCEQQTRNDLDPQITGLRKDRVPLKILGVSSVSTSKLTFVMSYVDCEQMDIVLAEEANIACPQIVIQFYESIIKWANECNDDV